MEEMGDDVIACNPNSGSSLRQLDYWRSRTWRTLLWLLPYAICGTSMWPRR
jgi:hypothetical protein